MRRLKEQSCAEATLKIVAAEYIVVDTTLATLPEFRISSEVLEGHWLET